MPKIFPPPPFLGLCFMLYLWRGGRGQVGVYKKKNNGSDWTRLQPNWNWTGFYLNWFEQKINARFYKTSLVNWILYTKLVQLTELVFAGIKFLLLEKPSLKLIPFFWKTQFEISVVLRTCLKLVQNQFGSKPFIKTSPVLSRFSKPIRLFEYKTDLIDSEPVRFNFFTEPVFAHP